MSAIPDLMSGIADFHMRTVHSNFRKIIGFLLCAVSIGVALAWVGIATGLALGWIGALVMIGWAILVRRHWLLLRDRDGSEPGAPERVVWQRFSGYSMVAGHMTFSVLNPQYDLHVGSGNYLAIDNWTLILGVVISAMLFRADSYERDERDDRIDALATLWGYRSLIGLMVALLTFVGFMPPDSHPLLGHFPLANLMVGTILLSLIVRQATQLLLYAGDSVAQS